MRTPAVLATLNVDPVAALTTPFTASELLAVVRAATVAKLEVQEVAEAAQAPPPLPHLHRRLVVGFVSSYFREHNLLRLCRSLFLQYDRSKIRFVLFAESDDDGSHILREVQSAADSFTRIRSMPSAQAVRAMSEQSINIAINLNGHHWNAASESVRFGLFGPSAAPVRGAYMGYPGPCGAPGAIEYAYVDAAAVPARDAFRGFTERMTLLPHTYYLNDYAQAHAELPRTRVPPSADRLPRHCALLCSLNQLPKLDPSLYATWINALSRSAATRPCTRLWLLKFPAAGEAHLRLEAQAHMSPPPHASLIGLPTVGHREHLRRAQHCDLMLDSAMCNAHTSGTDALWAGTPMVTMPGDSQTARVALSLLKSVGQWELAVVSLRAFEDAVAALTTGDNHAVER